MSRIVILLFLLCSFGNAARAADAAPPRFVVFFTEWSAAFDQDAQGVISQAAALAKSQPRQVVRVIGYADPTGSKQANILLSQLRAQRAADQLLAEGVAAGRIQPVGRGSVHFAISAQESRRVEIAIGGR